MTETNKPFVVFHLTLLKLLGFRQIIRINNQHMVKYCEVPSDKFVTNLLTLRTSFLFKQFKFGIQRKPLVDAHSFDHET